ncbi:MAG TPA: DOMON-like domain-containing protein [Caulobacteraceae bacterium]|jgi:hypothetical protein|nr:DOMON-like domain-containing protein [Caulobacteraceae bacterium]
MPLLRLAPHPDGPPTPLTGIEVEVERVGARLELHFRARGRIEDVAVPAPVPQAAQRRDDLWKHTCFEAFLAAGEGGYVEFNLSPSGEWAAYQFNGYREGATNAAVAPPEIRASALGELIELQAAIELPEVIASMHPLRLGLSAVIEDVHGGRTYWALAHAPGKPDFHHAHAFASELP